MSAHTPGPWMIYRGEKSVIGVGSPPEGRMVCRMDMLAKDHYHRLEADALLIEAAPMLLEALEALDVQGGVLDSWLEMIEGGTDEMFNAVHKARAALRAAKGET